MPRPAIDLARMVAAVRILGEDRSVRFVVGGEPFEAAPPAAETAAAADASEEPAVRSLAQEIYQRLYTRAGPPQDWKSNPGARRQHLAGMSEANCGRGTWEPGWTVRGIEPDGRVSVVKDGLTFWARPERLRLAGQEIAAGARCRVRVGKELKELQPGFYIAVGDGDHPDGGPDAPPDEAGREAGPLVRLYWHLTAAGAAPFLRRLTARLNAAGLPFRAKVLSDPGSYRRADAGVLYLDLDVYPAARRAVAAVYREVCGELRPSVPMLTRRLAPGLGVAEDPGDGQSFGQQRCRLVARGLWRAFEQGRTSAADRLEAVSLEFRQQGLDPCRPHLGAGSAAMYRRLSRVPARPAAARKAGPRLGAATGGDLLAAARRLGDALCGSAYRYRERCGWMGRSPDEARTPDAPVIVPTAAALGCNLYGGTAGVGLFLAQLHAATGEEAYRETARGAALQALDLADKPDGSSGPDGPDGRSPLGFYSGLLGVAWAARRIAELVGCAGLRDEADRLLAEATAGSGGEHLLDLIAGNAGGILALLALARSGAPGEPLRAAVALGEELCRAADRRDGTWSWAPLRASGGDFGTEPLTGLSHGAAGMGLALLELSAATGRADFRDGARRAFAYEDLRFDETRGNWPDLRIFDGEEDDADAAGVDGKGRPPRFATTWCHGAPGIALARLRALQIDPGGAAVYRPAAVAGLATTARAVEQDLENPRFDASLCHGLTGLAEVLWTGGRILGEPRYRALAVEATRAILARHGARGDWPSGAPSRGPSPSLMLGEAGVGYWLLRLHAGEQGDRVPSVLLPGAS